MTAPALLATVSRDGIVESSHYGDLVVCDTAGKVIAALGDPDRVAYYRSSGKPLQALPVVESGAADKYHFTAAELAVCCASHSGSRAHVLTVQGILEKLGLDETALACGVHQPGDAAEQQRLRSAGEEPSPLHNNCSGKHAGMLAVARALDAPVAGYLHRDHPVQQRLNRDLALATDLSVDRFHFGQDGCGAPTVALPLRHIAQSFARLAHPAGLRPQFALAARRIVSAMAAAPEMVAAPGSFNTDLLAAGGGHLVAKTGAEGLFVAGIVDPRGWGLAFKIADGSSRPHAPVAVAALQQMGALSTAQLESLTAYVNPPVTNCHGVHVGNVTALVALGL